MILLCLDMFFFFVNWVKNHIKNSPELTDSKTKLKTKAIMFLLLYCWISVTLVPTIGLNKTVIIKATKTLNCCCWLSAWINELNITHFRVLWQFIGCNRVEKNWLLDPFCQQVNLLSQSSDSNLSTSIQLVDWSTINGCGQHWSTIIGWLVNDAQSMIINNNNQW